MSLTKQQEAWRDSFISGMEYIQEGNPDGPVLVLGAAYMDSVGSPEFPCAVGGRNMDLLTPEMQGHMISAILRSAFELCMDYAGEDKEAGRIVFEKAMEVAFDFNMSGTDTVSLDREDGPEDMADKFKRAIRSKMDK